LERRQFTAVEASGKVEQVAHVLAESLNGQNPTGRLHSEALRHMLWAVPKLKMEIPVHTVGEHRDGCMISAVFEPKRRFRINAGQPLVYSVRVTRAQGKHGMSRFPLELESP
jgi:hypothetical protein